MIEQPASRLTVVCRFIYQTDIPLIGGKIRKLGKSTILGAWLEHNIDIFLCTPVHCIFPTNDNLQQSRSNMKNAACVLCSKCNTAVKKNPYVMCLESELMYFQIYWIYLFIYFY